MTLICLSATDRSQKTDIRAVTSILACQANISLFAFFPPTFPIHVKIHPLLIFSGCTLLEQFVLFFPKTRDIVSSADVSRMGSAPLCFIPLSVGVFELLL